MTQKKKPTKSRTLSVMKPASPPRPIVGSRSVLVLHEKHGNQYFVVDDDEGLFAAALTILRRRLMSDWYYGPGTAPAPLDYVQDDIAKLPPSFRDDAQRKLKDNVERTRVWQYESKIWEDVNSACSSADGRLAWQILKSRSDHEYERVSIEEARRDYPYFTREEMESSWEDRPKDD